MNTEPGYMRLYMSGELEKRAGAFKDKLRECTICPRNCGVNRTRGEQGFCHSGFLPIVASYCAHHGEEPPLSGTRGSGTIFFGNCNLCCVYCQNYQISQDWRTQRNNETEINTLTARMLYLQDELKCHNINLVTPSHFVPQIVLALLEAVPLGLNIPLVYNSSGYDSLDTIRMLEGIIDIYLPDLRYADNSRAKSLSRAPDYVERARGAIKEMYRQVGNPETDRNGIAVRGLIVRHLILPERVTGSKESLTWLAEEISPAVTVSVMAQYYPAHQAGNYPSINRQITKEEYSEVVTLLDELDLKNGWIQELDSPGVYKPDFTLKECPFGS